MAQKNTKPTLDQLLASLSFVRFEHDEHETDDEDVWGAFVESSYFRGVHGMWLNAGGTERYDGEDSGFWDLVRTVCSITGLGEDDQVEKDGESFCVSDLVANRVIELVQAA